MMNYLSVIELNIEQNGQKQTLYPVILQDESDTILVDCGYPGCMQLLEESTLKLKIPFHSITKLLLTHDDVDHIGSAAAIKRKYPHIEIMAFESEAKYIDGSAKSLRIVQAESSLSELAGEAKINAEYFIRYLKSVEPVQVDRLVHSDENLSWCDGTQVIHTPGHTPGHISLYLPLSKTLIAADAIVIQEGRINIANPEYCLDIAKAIRSVERLMEYDIDHLVCYHGGIFYGDVRQALHQLIQEYARGR